jgi:hypothetical protein
VNPWLTLLLTSLSWFVGGFLTGWLMNLYQQRQWRRYTHRRLAENAEIMQRLDEEQ